MLKTSYRNRRAVQLENEILRLTVLEEGAHIAELQHRETGVNPLWTPPWPSIEPTTYDPASHPEYGDPGEARLLAGIMGHNLCLDIFGPPSAEEAAAGLSVHGDAPVVNHSVAESGGALVMAAELGEGQLGFERKIRLEGPFVRISETVENRARADCPVGWTQHVTIGPPFLEMGSTQLRMPATRSKVIGESFSNAPYMRADAEFDWPLAPRLDGGTADIRTAASDPVSGSFTAHLMDPRREKAYFFAWSPASKVLLGYIWKRADFPWVGLWEENHSRTSPPWNGRTITRAIEFGVSPFPETRRQMIDRGTLFGERCFRWIPARTSVTVEYVAFVTKADAIPENEEQLRVG